MEDSALNRYLDEIGKEALLSDEVEKQLSSQMLKGDTKALSRLVEANLRFVVAVARQYKGKGVAMEDLVSEGNIGLMKAASKYDASKGVRFVNYAVVYVRQAIEKFIDKSEGQGTDLVKQTTVNHTSADDFDYYVIKVSTPNVDMKTLSKFTVTDTIKNCLGGSVAVVKMTNSEGTSIVSSKGPGGYSSGVQNNGGDWIVTVDLKTPGDTC